MKKKTAEAKRDPCDNYEGPLRDINGRRPYNGHFSPTDSWWASHCGPWYLHRSAGFTMRFMIVGLQDGRWCSDTTVSHIEKNDRQYRFRNETPAELKIIPCVFPTRLQAVRAAAAELIRHIRSAARNKARDEAKGERFSGWRDWFGAVSPEQCIEWARAIVSYEEWRAANPEAEDASPDPS